MGSSRAAAASSNTQTKELLLASDRLDLTLIYIYGGRKARERGTGG